MDRPNREILEAIECCRPGGEDVRTPDMARLAEAIEADPALRAKCDRIQGLDAHIGRVFRDVPVPDGLQDRVLAELVWDEANTNGATDREVLETETTIDDLEAESPRSLETPVLQPAAHVGRRREVGRSWWYAAAAGTAAVVLIAVAITAILQMAADSEMSWEDFRQLVDASISTAIDDNAWDGDLAAVPTDRRFPSDDFEINPIGWRYAPLGSFDDRATAYLLSDRRQSEVVLLVTRSRRPVTRVTEVCPSKSLPTSGNQSVGAWRSGGYLFVLVVRGRDHRERYRSTIPRLQVG